jgi:hypothetical protein
VTDWFTPHVTIQSITPDNPPQPELQDVHLDDHGYLWTATLVAGQSWELALGPRINTPEGPTYRMGAFEDIYDTLVEVIDPTGGRLLASQRIPQLLIGFLEDDYVAALHTDSLDVPYVDIYRVQFKE